MDETDLNNIIEAAYRQTPEGRGRALSRRSHDGKRRADIEIAMHEAQAGQGDTEAMEIVRAFRAEQAAQPETLSSPPARRDTGKRTGPEQAAGKMFEIYRAALRERDFMDNPALLQGVRQGLRFLNQKVKERDPDYSEKARGFLLLCRKNQVSVPEELTEAQAILSKRAGAPSTARQKEQPFNLNLDDAVIFNPEDLPEGYENMTFREAEHNPVSMRRGRPPGDVEKVIRILATLYNHEALRMGFEQAENSLADDDRPGWSLENIRTIWSNRNNQGTTAYRCFQVVQIATGEWRESIAEK